MKRLILVSFLVTALLGAMPLALQAQEAGDPVSQHIFKRCEYLEQFSHIPVCSTCVASHKTIPAFYRNRNYRPAWTDSKAIGQMLEAIEESRDDGLMPRDYHYQVLVSMKKSIRDSNQPDPSDLADFDMLLTDALLRLSYHLYYGKVNPESLDPDWNFRRNIHKIVPEVYLQKVIDSGDILNSLDKLRPQYPYYGVLKEGLKRYRQFEKHPWPKIPVGKGLKKGMRDPRIPILAKRLEAEGYQVVQEGNSTDLFGKGIEAAVKDFQKHHGLEPDGIVGKNTIRELNVGPNERVSTIRVNLERARWILHDLDPEFLIVNIAGFKLYFVKDGKRMWECKVMVGKPFWKTPCFRATVEYVVINPYWVVPPGILSKEVIPKIKANPSYLARQNLEIVDSKGRIINPGSINWSRINPNRFPYIIRQRPGPKNALGRIKFIFPNKHFVFLHDTPARNLFSRPMRAFSHGCIRVEKPLELVDILFHGSKRWNRKKVEELIAKKETKTIHLERPMPILILYWTASPAPDGRLVFLRDIYERDHKILIGLDTPLKIANVVFPWKQAKNL